MDKLILRNRIAAFLWGFAAVWLGMLSLFTWVLIRDGAPEDTSPGVMWSVVAVFWLGGAGLSAYVLNKPCYIVAANADAVTFTWQYPHRRVRKTCPTADLAPPSLVEEKDSDGDPYFRVRLQLPDGSVANLAEGHDRDTCQAVLDRFTKAVAPPAA